MSVNIREYLTGVQIEYLKRNQKWLKLNKFTEFYQNMMDNTWYSYFTALFLACDINPLDYMSIVPDYFAQGLPEWTKPLPSHIIQVGQSSFENTSMFDADLTNVDTLSAGSFRYTPLTNVNFGDKLTIIPTECFRGCYNLDTLSIPESIEEIGGFAFEGCFELESVRINNPDCILSDYFPFRGCNKNLKFTVTSDKVGGFIWDNGFRNLNVI